DRAVGPAHQPRVLAPRPVGAGAVAGEVLEDDDRAGLVALLPAALGVAREAARRLHDQVGAGLDPVLLQAVQVGQEPAREHAAPLAVGAARVAGAPAEQAPALQQPARLGEVPDGPDRLAGALVERARPGAAAPVGEVRAV